GSMRTSPGATWTTPTRPSAQGSPVRSYSSQPTATETNWVPMAAAMRPRVKARTWGLRRAANGSWTAGGLWLCTAGLILHGPIRQLAPGSPRWPQADKVQTTLAAPGRVAHADTAVPGGLSGLVDDQDGHPVDDVVTHAAGGPVLFERLNVAGLVLGTAAQLVPAWD